MEEEQSIEKNESKTVSWLLNSSPNSRIHPIGYQQKGIGLALEEDEEISDYFSKANTRKMVLFGAELKKVQVPEPLKKCDLVELKSPSDFGIKTKNSQFLQQQLDSSPVREREGRLSISLKEMELSEEYTCVMKRGNDPKIVHIFDDVIVETCCGDEDMKEFRRKGKNGNSEVEDDDGFLGICYNCKVKLGGGKDIFMYRGEKSFCSSECRFQEMIREEDVHYYY